MTISAGYPLFRSCRGAPEPALSLSKGPAFGTWECRMLVSSWTEKAGGSGRAVDAWFLKT